MDLKIVKGDLFMLASRGSVLVHGCNCQGMWGSGVAAMFADRFPDSYMQYRKRCLERKKEREDGALGEAWLFPENDFFVGCLMTSRKYGKAKDSEIEIIKATRKAMAALVPQLEKLGWPRVYSPKLNAGLFQVPWHYTESAIEEAIKDTPCKWTVCSR